MDSSLIKPLFELGIVGVVVGIFVWFELCLWKSREENQRKDKCDMVKVLQDTASALAMSAESLRQVRELLVAILGRRGSDDKEI
jgi:hypothetical protein